MTSERARRANVVSAEAEPIQPRLAPLSTAFTFAQTRLKGRTVTLIVADYDGDSIAAVDLTAFGAPVDADVFDALEAVGEDGIVAALSDGKKRKLYRVADLLPSGAPFERHLATGTNFAEHAKEAGIGRVFNFPKFGAPTPARTTVVVRSGTLMDYEVEISVRFDRDIRSMDDFHAARKGFFVCGDFTDRALMMRLINPADIPSGHGFSDSKSGPDFFPTGPFLVIPHDWRSFVAEQRIVTSVNGTVRQDARGAEMILDFEALVQKALGDGATTRWRYRSREVPLIEGGVIPRGAAVMSGTSEGVIFMPPMKQDRIEGVIDHVLRGRFLRGVPVLKSVVERFIDNELAAGRYLQVGDIVEHASSEMGVVSIELIRP